MPKLLTDYIQKSATALEISFQHFETLITEMQTSGALTEKEANEKRTAFHAQLMRDAPEIVQISVSNLMVNAASKRDILKKIDEWFWQPQFTTDDNQALDESFLSLSNHVNQRSIALQNKVNAALEKAVDILRGAGELSL